MWFQMSLRPDAGRRQPTLPHFDFVRGEWFGRGLAIRFKWRGRELDKACLRVNSSTHSSDMPAPSSIAKSIQAFRTFVTSGGDGSAEQRSPYSLCLDLFRIPERILENEETLDAVLALAPEIEAYRGKGSRTLQRAYDQHLGGLLFHTRLKAFEASPTPGLFLEETEAATRPAPPPFWAKKLSDYFFERVQGKPARSLHAAGLRSSAWFILGELSGIYRRSEPFSLALKTAADKRRADEEREGAIQFLAAYWAHEDPDKATVDLLESLRQDPPNRSFLVTVLEAQIELGLNDEMGALFDVEGWDDEEDEGEEE